MGCATSSRTCGPPPWTRWGSSPRSRHSRNAPRRSATPLSRFDSIWPHEAGREPTRLDSELEDTIYRVVQEALANVVKHSAASKAYVDVREVAGGVEITVRDEGSGFDGSGQTGFGLVGMRERVTLLGGTLEIESVLGGGTTVRVSLPARRGDAAGPRAFEAAAS